MDDVDMKVLEQLIRAAVRHAKATHPTAS